MKLIRVFSIFLLFITGMATAGTIVEIQNKHDRSTILTDGKQARMNTTGSEYIIINYKDSSVKAVDPSRQKVMLLNTDDIPRGSGKAPKVRTSVNKLGSGPVIAGYETEKFSYKVNGKSCGIVYGSKEAYKLKGVKELFKAMQTMVENQRAVMGGYAGMIDDCTRGDMEMSDHIATVGVPMRMEGHGTVDSEIKSIKLNVTLPADTFVIPASYQTVTIKDEMKNAQSEMMKMQNQMQQHQPQIQQMMQQLQQSGNLPPEAMEQMRRAQEQMQQYQQR